MADFSYVGPGRTIVSSPYGFTIREKDGTYYDFVPRSVFEKGVVEGDTQYYFPSVLSNPDFFNQVQQNSRFLTTEAIEKQVGKDFTKDLEKYGFKDTDGYLFPLQSTGGQYFTSWIDQNVGTLDSYKIGQPFNLDGGAEALKMGPITGVATKPSTGERVFSYAVQDPKLPNAQGFVAYNPEINKSQLEVSWYEPPPKWAKTANIIGGTLIGLGTAGLAGFGPLAAPSATAGTAAGGAAGTGAGMVGTPGVSTIYPVAAPAAPTVGSLAPITTATAVPASQLAFPALEIGPTFTPAPGSLQAALPGLGVETAASAAPYTAAPGSFQAALPAFGVATSPGLANTVSNVMSTSSSPSITDALRMANALTGQPQQVPQQRPMGGQAGRAGGVDYSGVLGLLQTRAATANVSPLLRPATLLPQYNSLSLLG